MAPIYLLVIILIVFIMICIMKDAQWHLAQNLSFCYTVTENSGRKIAQGVKLHTLLLL